MANPDEIYEMSDEEFLKLDPKSFSTETSTGDKVETKTESADDTTDDDSADVAEDDTTEAKEDAEDAAQAPEKATEVQTKSDADPSIGKLTDKPTEANTEPDYAAIGKLLMSEFKANGSILKMKSAEDAITLMQMGANYHKKMAGLKPSLKTLKLLESNGLLDEAKLNYLIDLSQNKPEAITQLLKDSKIDPLSIDVDSEQVYTPSQRAVNDTEILLDEVLDSISTSPAYSRTLTVLGDEWDQVSRTAIAKTPEVIQVINQHIESGIYDQVAQAIAYERSMGKLVGVNDYDAYQRVGSYMHEHNLFTGQANVNKTPASQTVTKSTTQTKSESDAQNQQRMERKQAASPSRQQKAPTTDNSNYNPLEMSDEEFIKLNKLRI